LIIKAEKAVLELFRHVEVVYTLNSTRPDQNPR
jgi:hypothetical protein